MRKYFTIFAGLICLSVFTEKAMAGIKFVATDCDFLFVDDQLEVRCRTSNNRLNTVSNFYKVNEYTVTFFDFKDGHYEIAIHRNGTDWQEAALYYYARPELELTIRLGFRTFEKKEAAIKGYAKYIESLTENELNALEERIGEDFDRLRNGFKK